MNQNKPSLSAVIIASNAAAHIGGALLSVEFADQVVVVIDSTSTDQTENIARASGADVYINPWPGYGAQKNFGLAKTTGDWVLFLDSDEQVTPELADHINQTIIQAQFDFYWIRIITYFLNRPLNHLYGHNLRLFKKTAGQWTNDKVHEQVITAPGQRLKLGDNISGLIKEPLNHFSHLTIGSYLKKMRRYTSLDAKQMAKTGAHRSGKPVSLSLMLPFKLSLKQLIKLLFYRQGIRDGYAGIVWCFLSAYYEFDMAQKYQQILRTRH